MSFTYEDLIHPLPLKDFYDIYHRKRWCVIKGNDFKKNLFSKTLSWKQFSDYINNDRAVSGMQAILPNGEKLCLEKNNLYKNKIPSWSRKDYFEKKYLHNIWSNHGSIILTKASLLTKEISSIAYAIEKEFKGACDAHFYCSKTAKSRSFDPHIDHDDNFLVHAHGSVKWTICNTLDNKGNDTTSFNLTNGDLLYIPKGLAHSAVPLSKRISISVPLLEFNDMKTNTITPMDRKYYDFS
tara:strand:+ start:286 stop:1002 length:717 start_codon:yes stop_codon:yes gene_type:complete